MKRNLLIATLLSFISLPALADNVSSLPAALIYKDKPIDPLCLFESENKTIKLDQCGIDAEAGRKTVGTNDVLLEKGYVGFDYSWPASPTFQAQGESYYKLIAQVAKHYFLLTFNNTGGSGQFTGLYDVQRDKNKLHVTSIAGGDRCNTGVANAYKKDNQLFYDVNLTSYDLFDLAKQNPHHLKAYDDLAACAACCMAKVTYAFTLQNPPYKQQLISINLGKEKIAVDENSQGKYQFCFEKLVANLQEKEGQFVNLPQLKTLVQTFNKTCLKK